MGLCKSFSKLFSAAIMMALPAYSLAQQSSTWRFEQLYSAPDGFAQFAVIYPDPNTPNVNALNNFTMTSVHTTAEHNHTPGYVSTFNFPNPLPGSTATPARRVLIGTQAFADLNIVAPDYIIGNEFFPQQSGVVNLIQSATFAYDGVGYASLPSNGVDSLYRDGSTRQNLAINFAGVSASVPLRPPPNALAQAVEYYYAAWDHYFITTFADEIAALDAGVFNGNWKRTGESFKVWTQGSATTPAACRFFSSSFAPKSSHFYTLFATECATVKQSPDWQFEGVAFYMQPASLDGTCLAGSIPLYRIYNNGMGEAPNHRYTTSVTKLEQMVGAGWTFEGNGITKVFACVPE